MIYRFNIIIIKLQQGCVCACVCVCTNWKADSKIYTHIQKDEENKTFLKNKAGALILLYLEAYYKVIVTKAMWY